MAPDNLRRSVLLVALALTACGGGDKKASDDAAVDLAALRAKRDSVHQADSLVRARFATCSDSVLVDMAKTPAGKKKLANKPPEGMIRPEVLTACGKPPVAPLAPADTSKQLAAAPAAASQAPKPGLTPQQLQVQRADSLRRERERMRADSLASGPRRAGRIRSIGRRPTRVRGDSLQRARETEVTRETFTYGGGARDPFVSLITTPASVRSSPTCSCCRGSICDLPRQQQGRGAAGQEFKRSATSCAWATRSAV